MAPVATEGHGETCGLGRQLVTMLVSEAHAVVGLCKWGWPILPPGAMVTSWPKLLPRTVSKCMVLPQPMAELMSLARDATRGYTMDKVYATICDHVLIQGPCCHWD